ncbi:MAG: hypothetical protein JWO76_2745 [Nocardioides sp.]|nr:hypothetical protein [Nocardioides sp.]
MLSGLAALVGVGLAVGVILGLGVLMATQVLGIGGGSDTSDSSGGQTMYLPRPEKTQAPSGPLITLEPGATQSTTVTPTEEPSETESARKQISLSASQTAVAPMQQIDLTGVYPGGEGSILQVQRFTGGSWTDFPVTASVSNETFTTYVQTSQPGVNRFRVVDTDTDLKSNEVRVTVG